MWNLSLFTFVPIRKGPNESGGAGRGMREQPGREAKNDAASPGGGTAKPTRVAVSTVEGERLNGLGMMLVQYLEQNLAEFEQKVERALRLRGRVSVEVEKGVATTVSFLGDRILVENGVCRNPDLHIRGSYLLLARILSGKASPFREIARGNLKLARIPTRPVACLKTLAFLKVPSELLLEPEISRRRAYLVRAAGAVLGAGAAGGLVYALWRLLGGG